jgi:UDP-N-acetyl-D-glucosamine dehydrogenase
MKKELLDNIETRKAVIGVIGQGYVGLPLALEFAKAGFTTIGFDVDADKVARLNRGESYIIDIADEELKKVVDSGRLKATTDFSLLKKVDCVSICVPTPLRKTKDPDISYIVASMDCIIKHAHKGLLITLESTTYPGTTDELVKEPLEKLGYKAGKDLFVCFSPERVDPGNPTFHTKNTPKIIGGSTPACQELGKALYATCIQTVHTVGSPAEAEMVKLLENTFRAVNIALVNEMMMMCNRMGINIWNVINAAATKPFGFMPFYPGPGIGGHCIPLDPTYLSWKAKTVDFYNRFIELATDINGNMPNYVIQRVAKVLNDHSKPIRGSKILILGMSYKPNIDDLRESPALEVYRLLRREGAWVEYNDPHAPSFISMLKKTIKSTPLSAELLKKQDLCVLVTNHKAFDYDFIVKHAPLILDTRNAFAKFDSPNIVRL